MRREEKAYVSTVRRRGTQAMRARIQKYISLQVEDNGVGEDIGQDSRVDEVVEGEEEVEAQEENL